jgi:hypothetical protein
MNISTHMIIKIRTVCIWTTDMPESFKRKQFDFSTQPSFNWPSVQFSSATQCTCYRYPYIVKVWYD